MTLDVSDDDGGMSTIPFTPEVMRHESGLTDGQSEAMSFSH